MYPDPNRRDDHVPGSLHEDEPDDLLRFTAGFSKDRSILPGKKGILKFDEGVEYGSTATTGNAQPWTATKLDPESRQTRDGAEPYDVGTALIDIEERTRIEARARAATAEIRQVAGNITIPDHTVVDGSLVVDGKLRVGKGSHVHGSLKALRGIEISERVTVDGHVLSEGPILVGKNSMINGMVDSSDDIMLDQGATAEGVFTNKTIILREGARINRKISSSRHGGTPKEQFGIPGEAAFNLSALRTSMRETPFVLSEALEESSAGAPPIRWGAAHEDRPPSHASPKGHLDEPFVLAPQSPREKERFFLGASVIPFERPELGSEHLFIYAPVRSGKTFLVKNFIIPKLRENRRIITVDSHNEYSFPQYVISYDRTIPDVENELMKSFVTFNVRTDVDNIIRDAIFRIVTEEDNASIVLNIADSSCERMIVSEFLRRLTQIKWSEPILLVLEDADKYDLTGLVAKGSYSNIQAVFMSWRRLIPEILHNVRMVLGSVRPELVEEYDSNAARAVTELEKFEFLWEKGHHQWVRFKLEAKPETPTAVTLPAAKTKPDDMMVRIFEQRPASPITEPIPATSREQTRTERAAPVSREETGKQSTAEMRAKPPEAAVRPEMTKREAKVVRLKTAGLDDTEIGLRLFMDPVEVQNILLRLKERGLYDKDRYPESKGKDSMRSQEQLEDLGER